MTEGEFVPYLPPPEKIVELLEKLDQGVALGTGSLYSLRPMNTGNTVSVTYPATLETIRSQKF
jgi:hypothetical protein